jgi:integrase
MEWIKTKYPGIRYREHATRKHGIQPDRYYVLTYKLNGKTKSEALGWASEGMTLDKAAQAMAEIKTNRRTGEGPETLAEKKRIFEEKKAAIEAERLATEQAEAERIRLESETIFDVVFKRYCESNIDKKSLHDESTLIRLWVEPVVKGKRLDEITSFHIERIKRDMTKAGRAVRSIQYTFAIIRQVFNYAKRMKIYNGESPTKAVKLPKFDNKRKRFLSVDEANALLEEIKKHSLISYRFSLFSLYSGMRFGEIAKLKWQAVDIEHKQITILDPKNGTSRTAFMADSIVQMFSEMIPGKANDLVFISRAGNEIKFISNQ